MDTQRPWANPESPAYQEGFIASKYGVDIDNNPHAEGTEERRQWVFGHNAWYRYWQQHPELGYERR